MILYEIDDRIILSENPLNQKLFEWRIADMGLLFDIVKMWELFAFDVMVLIYQIVAIVAAAPVTNVDWMRTERHTAAQMAYHKNTIYCTLKS